MHGWVAQPVGHTIDALRCSHSRPSSQKEGADKNMLEALDDSRVSLFHIKARMHRRSH